MPVAYHAASANVGGNNSFRFQTKTQPNIWTRHQKSQPNGLAFLRDEEVLTKVGEYAIMKEKGGDGHAGI